MELYYENSRKERVDLTKEPYLVKDMAELLDYTWKYDTEDEMITGFSRGICTIPLSVNIYADTEEEYRLRCNEMYSVFEYDILNNQRGRLYFDGQYITCNVISNKKEDWDMGILFRILNLQIVTDQPVWIGENSYVFHSYEVKSKDNKRYPGKYGYRYANGLSNNFVVNPHFFDSNFTLRIYGPVTNPQVNIGGNAYLVNITLEDGERLEIDTRSATIYKILRNGNKENAFHCRKKGVYFFKKISPGRQGVSWTGKFDFDLIIYEERSEPQCG